MILRGRLSEDWRGAFATRIFPAIPLVRDLINQAEKNEISWEEYAVSTFSEVLAQVLRVGPNWIKGRRYKWDCEGRRTSLGICGFRCPPMP